MSLYQIDATPVNSRGDWRHTLQAGRLTARRTEGFPADPNVYVIKGKVLPVEVTIAGYIAADTMPNLHAALRVLALVQEDLTLHSITIGGSTITYADLRSFRVIAPIVATSAGVMIMVIFDWQGVISV